MLRFRCYQNDLSPEQVEEFFRNIMHGKRETYLQMLALLDNPKTTTFDLACYLQAMGHLAVVDDDK